MNDFTSVTEATTPNVSRAVIMHQITVVREELGEQVHAKAIAGMDDAEAEVLTRPDRLGWCTSGVVRRYKDAVAQQTGQGSLDFQRWIVRRSAERTVNGLWRMLLSQVWDTALVKRIPILYRRTYDRGQMVGSFREDRTAQLTVTGWSTTMPEYEMAGLQAGVEAVLSLTGRHHVSARPSGTPDGAAFQVRWRVTAEAAE